MAGVLSRTVTHRPPIKPARRACSGFSASSTTCLAHSTTSLRRSPHSQRRVQSTPSGSARSGRAIRRASPRPRRTARRRRPSGYAVAAAGGVDPAKLHLLVIPFSLATSADGKSAVERTTLTFDSVEFLSQ